MVEYQAKVDFLKKVLDCRAVAQSSAVSSKYEENILRRDVVDVAGGTRRRSLRSSSPPPISELTKTIPILPHGPASTGETIAKEIHLKVVENHNEHLRGALFGNDDSNVRKRNVPEQGADNDLDFLIKAHHQAQEQVAEEMLSLTKTLKEQSLAAKEVILKDTAVIEKANENADKNTTKLKTESDRLQEHTKFSCRCWIWFLLMVVTFTFIGMPIKNGNRVEFKLTAYFFSNGVGNEAIQEKE